MAIMLERMTTMSVVALFFMFRLGAILPIGMAATLSGGQEAARPDKESGPGSAALLRTEVSSQPASLHQQETTSLDVRADGTASRDHRAEPYIEGQPQLEGSLIDAGARTGNMTTCGELVKTVLGSIKFHLGTRKRSSFVSESEARLYTYLNDGGNGVEVLTNAMRVLGNFTLAEGLMAGTIWTVDHQNRFVACMQNIDTRLEEHEKNEHGDVLIQGDMAVTSSLCHYSEQSSKVSNTLFPVGTHNCLGVSGCQFSHPDEAVHFCNLEPECTMIMGKADAAGCDGGLGCYMPKKGLPEADATWSVGGGKTYIKSCPGSMLELQNAVQQGVRAPGTRWNNGEVAYCFSAEISQVAEEAFHLAVKSLEKQVPCLKFNRVDRHNDTHCENTPSIIVQAQPSGCWSYLGQVSGKEKAWLKRSQPLNLDRGCETVGFVLHQLGHALGMIHENSRSDRTNVMTLNMTNAKSGKASEFGMSQDVVKYAWDGYDSCTSRAGRTKMAMKTSDCLKISGLPETTESADTIIQCQLDLCIDGKYFPAPRHFADAEGISAQICKEKVADVSIKMERRDCTAAHGTPSGAGESYHWTDCTFDLCTDMGLHVAKPFACGNKLAHGYLHTPIHDCQNMEGMTPGTGTGWVNCYFDFCSGEFDAPFDFLSLMMYSPKAWSKTGEEKTLVPLGNHSDIISSIMGQRMGFSGLDIFHLGHMYNCWDQIKPDFDSKEVSRKIITGEYFEFKNGTCEDKSAEHTGLDVHGEDGFMKHASCDDLMQYCHNETDGMGVTVRQACPVSCFTCMPHHGLINKMYGENGACFDAVNTGIRFKDGPRASCKDLVKYCKHETIGAQVTQACKMSCGHCEPHIYAPFYDANKHCTDLGTDKEPQFTIEGKLAPCEDLEKFCQDHTDSFVVRHKCPKTCGLCAGEDPHMHKPPPDVSDIYIPGDKGDCSRRRRFGFCSTRRRRNV